MKIYLNNNNMPAAKALSDRCTRMYTLKIFKYHLKELQQNYIRGGHLKKSDDEIQRSQCV